MAIDPRDEAHRQLTLKMLSILDTAPEREFDAVARAARRIFGCETSFVSLIDRDRQWLKAKEGTDETERPRSASICARAVERREAITTPDLSADRALSHIVGPEEASGLRFLSTHPVRGPEIDGKRVPIGTLCVVGGEPHRPSEAELDELEDLTQILEALFEARLAAKLACERDENRQGQLDHYGRTLRQFELAEQMANLGSWRLDLKTHAVEWSKQTQRIHGIEDFGDGVLANALDYYPPGDRARLTAALETCIADGTAYDLELDFRNLRGELLRVRAMGEAEWEGGEIVALYGVFQDMTERHRLEMDLRRAAFTDQLTGLANRRRVTEELDRMIDEAWQGHAKLAVALIDLDNFKTVNDRFGHEAGDRVLRVMAAKLKSTPFDACLAARLGGDELLLVIDDAALLETLEDTIDLLLRELRVEVGEKSATVQVTATIGTALLAPDAKTRSELLKRADLALYSAKARQRGTAEIYTPARRARRAGGARLAS